MKVGFEGAHISRTCFPDVPFIHHSSMVAALCHFVISSFRLFAWRLFVISPRNNARRIDAKTKKRNGTNQPPYSRAAIHREKQNRLGAKRPSQNCFVMLGRDHRFLVLTSK